MSEDEEPSVRGLGHDEHTAAEYEWLKNVYQGDSVKQLSVRSIITGMLIGGVMSVSNLYVGLKTGWGLGVTITACIIAFAVYRALEAVLPSVRKNPFTILENYTMSSAASAAGYMSSAGLVSAIPALTLTTGRELLWWEMMAWLGALSALGVFMAIPLKRQLINIDKLPFPSGIATAETLKSMHSSGADAMQKAKALIWSAGLGAVVALWRDGWPPLAGWFGRRKGDAELGKSLASWGFPEAFPLLPKSEWATNLLEKQTIGFEGSLIMIGAGAIMGIRVGVSLLLGAIIYYGFIGDYLLQNNLIEGSGYKAIVAWTLWPATAMMVTSGLLSFAMRWRTVVRAFSGMMALLGRKSKAEDPLERIEAPGSWFVVGTLVSGGACVVLGHLLFDIQWYMGILAVLLTFVLSIVAARATGETDVTPIGALGKITQLTFGMITPAGPGFMTTNLMTASITSGAAAHSADLLTDLKSGYLLGGNPRKQTISQLFGVLAGTLVCVPIYKLIVIPEKLGSKELPAPSAKVWEGVANMLANGVKNLPPGALWAMAIGAVIGIVITLLEHFTPQRFHKWIPSATGLGIAGVIPAFNSISMFLGALIAWLLAKSKPATDEKYTITVSSGLIAGESLMGVAIILWLQGPDMVEQLMKQVNAWFGAGG